jgi:hypothetical protein
MYSVSIALLIASKSGRSSGLRVQQARITSASLAGQPAGIVGRRPFWTTPTAACRGVRSA